MAHKIPIGLQLFSVRHDLEKDLRGTLQAVAKMGYEGVEFFGFPKHPARELRALLDECKLACCGWHMPFELVQDDKLDETIAFNRELGNKYIIIPGIPEESRRSRSDWLKLAAFFNELSEKLSSHGMVTGYHNHHVEFAPLNGEQPWDTFFGNTDKAIIMQLDLGNAMLGGADVISILEKYPGRATTIHLKPYCFAVAKDDPHAGFQPLIGEDDVPWHKVFELCESGGTEWYIIEYESDAYPPLEAVERCLTGLKKVETSR
ncbi:MAG: sugar phosphate isomerase/epimerase [Firmicutes bacterium]|nr:sugar phosphate isomerase/epimerase [Bacillota bacterium]